MFLFYVVGMGFLAKKQQQRIAETYSYSHQFSLFFSVFTP